MKTIEEFKAELEIASAKHKWAGRAVRMLEILQEEKIDTRTDSAPLFDKLFELRDQNPKVAEFLADFPSDREEASDYLGFLHMIIYRGLHED